MADVEVAGLAELVRLNAEESEFIEIPLWDVVDVKVTEFGELVALTAD